MQQQAHTFTCPSCGAPLSVGATDQKAIQCRYCGNTVIVPEALRWHAQANHGQLDLNALMSDAVKGDTAKMIQDAMAANPVVFQGVQSSGIPMQVYTSKSSRGFGLFGCGLIGAIVAFILVVTLVPIYFAFTAVSGVTNSVSSSFGDIMSSANALKSSLKGNDALMSFGSKGTGKGLLDDARYVAVDGNGNIFTGDYTSGRVQKFDSSGKFIKSWTVTGKTPLRWLAADQQGNFYAVRDGAIIKYDGTNTASIATFKADNYDDLVVLPDGGLLTYTSSIDGDIVWSNDKGKEVKRAKNAINSQSESSELDVKIAAGGLGNVYALVWFTSAVYKFTADGKFVNKFGSQGNSAGQFQSVQAIAVDGQGRVYVADINGVLIFDPSGRYISTIKLQVGTVPFGMSFTGKGDLVVTDRNKVSVYSVANLSSN